MIFIVYDSAQPPVQIMLYDLQIPFSSDLQAVTGWTQMSGSNVATDTMTYQSQMIISLICFLTCIVRYNAHIEMNSSLQEPIR